MHRRAPLGRGEAQGVLGKPGPLEGTRPRRRISQEKDARLFRGLGRHLGGGDFGRGGRGHRMGVVPEELAEKFRPGHGFPRPLFRWGGLPGRLLGHCPVVVEDLPGRAPGVLGQRKVLPLDHFPKDSPLRPGHGGEQDPLPHRRAPRQHPGIGGAGQALRQVFQVRGAIGEAVGEDEFLLGPGHGHVEQAHLLGQHLLLQGQGHPGPGQGGKLHHGLPVQSLGAQPQLGVEEDGLLDVGKVQPPAQAAEEDHRVLQPLGPVDGQDLHPAPLLGGRRRGDRPAALPHPA